MKKRKILIESTMQPRIFDWQTKTRKIRVLSAGLIFSANLRDISELKKYFIGPLPDGDKRWLEVRPDTTLDDFIWWNVAKNGRLPNMPPATPARKKRSRRSKSWTVKGSGNKVYTVTENNGYRSCTCPGFTYRRKCRHTNETTL